MNKKTTYTTAFLFLLILGFGFEIFYIKTKYNITPQSYIDKNIYVKNIALPDVTISTEAMYVRYRSLTSVFDIFKDDPTIYTYFPSTFAIAPSSLQTNISRIDCVKTK